MAATKTFFKQIPVKVVSKIAKVDMSKGPGKRKGTRNAGKTRGK